MSEENEILKILLQRIFEVQDAEKKQEAPQFSDGKKIALAFEGGGMRGVIEAAIAAAFESIARFAELVVEHEGDCLAARKALEMEQSDYKKTKRHAVNGVSWADIISCVSVGAPVGSFAAAKQARLRTPIFFEEMATPEFLNLNHLFGIAKREITDRSHSKDFRPPMDLGLMMKAIEDPEKGLDVAEVLRSNIPIRFAVTDLDVMKSKWIDPLEQGGTKLFELVKAACRIPGIAGKPEEGEPRYVDAMVSPLAIQVEKSDCLQKNFDYVVIFGSHPLGNRPEKKGFDISDLVTTWVSRAAMKDEVEAKRYIAFIKEQKIRSAQRIKESKERTDRYIYFGTPEGAEEITNATINSDKLKKQADLAYKYTMERLYKPLIDVLAENGVPVRNTELEDFCTPAFWKLSDKQEKPRRNYIRQITRGAFKKHRL